MTTDLVAVPDAGALEADPVEYMVVALNRAKGWLAEASSIDAVRETKAIAVGYESVIREKELAFDAQLSATEIVRRCERRIGELIREGQRNGTITTRGDNRYTVDGAHGDDLEKRSPAEFFASTKDRAATYAIADVEPEKFEAAISEAREEGNLSRANVARKVADEPTSAPGRSEWHHRTRRIDSNRILSTLAQELDAATSGLELIEPASLDPDVLADSIASIKRSLSVIGKHLRRIQ